MSANCWWWVTGQGQLAMWQRDEGSGLLDREHDFFWWGKVVNQTRMLAGLVTGLSYITCRQQSVFALSVLHRNAFFLETERQGSWGRPAAWEGRAGSFYQRQESLPCLAPFLGITTSLWFLRHIQHGKAGNRHRTVFLPQHSTATGNCLLSSTQSILHQEVWKRQAHAVAASEPCQMPIYWKTGCEEGWNFTVSWFRIVSTGSFKNIHTYIKK